MRYEASTPGSLIIASENWTDPNTARAAMRERLRALETEARAAEAEMERLQHAICHLLLRDGIDAGRVGKPLLARALAGEQK